MKTFLWVALSLLFLTSSSPKAPALPPRRLPPAEARAVLAALAPGDSSQDVQVDESAAPSQSLQEVDDLAARRRANLDQSGWLHLQTRTVQTHPDPLSPLTAGLGQFDQDQWLALDPSGRLQQAILRTTSETGEVLQVSLLKDGVWNNLTLGVQAQAGTAAPFDPNFGFDALAARLVRQGYSLNKGILYKECWYQGEKYTISDGHLLHEAVFNTGFQTLRWIKTWQLAPDGDVTLLDSLEIKLEERVPSPPPDILALAGG